MTQLLTTSIGRLRLYAFLEGISLVVLILIALPYKYLLQDPSLVRVTGPIHGALFLLFVFQALQVSIEQQWKFKHTTWKVLISCFIPLGTFYIDYKLLRQMKTDKKQKV